MNDLNYPFLSTDNSQLIFIHIPKTGGTSIRQNIGFYPPNRKVNIRKHYTAREIALLIGKTHWKNSYKFTFIRNPFQRIVSHYLYRRRLKRLPKIEHYHSFKQWCVWALSIEGQQAKKRFLLKSQWEWLRNNQNELDLNFIGRFETIEEDYQKLIRQLGKRFPKKLPQLNRSENYDYRTFYDNELIDLISSFYQKDCDYFGYEF